MPGTDSFNLHNNRLDSVYYFFKDLFYLNERKSTRAWEQRGEARKGRERQAVIMAGSVPAFCWNSVPQVVTDRLPCALSRSACPETSLEFQITHPGTAAPTYPTPTLITREPLCCHQLALKGPCSAGLRAGHPAGVQGSYNH